MTISTFSATQSRRGSALPILLTAGSIIAILVFGSASFIPLSAPSNEPSPAGAMLLTARIGLDPDALAAAGVNAQQIPGIVAEAKSTWQEIGNDLDAKDAAVRTATQTIESIEKDRAAGKAAPEAAATLAAARTSLQTAVTQRDALLQSAFNTITENLSIDQIGLLRTIQTNRGWHVPVQFMTVNRSKAQWLLLQNGGAPAHDREHPRLPSSSSPIVSANANAMTSASEHPAVMTAKANIDLNKGAIESAWKLGFEDVRP